MPLSNPAANNAAMIQKMEGKRLEELLDFAKQMIRLAAVRCETPTTAMSKVEHKRYHRLVRRWMDRKIRDCLRMKHAVSV